MIIAIIAGGSGTRLWPLSTSDYPKHLLKVNNNERSLLQHTYARSRKLTDKVYVVSDASHIHHVREQLPELPEEVFVVEPARRGTANCIMAALVHIGKQHGHDEPIAAIHADHFIRDDAGFVHSFKIAAKTSADNKRLVLVGAEPDYPATCFGYIRKGAVFDKASSIYNVRSFKEKPDLETAKKYVTSGEYLWNCGYFVGSIDTFRQKMKQYSPQMLANYDILDKANSSDYKQAYLDLKIDAIDYALIEKVQDLLVVPAAFDWMDIGSYNDMHKAVANNKEGNHIQGVVETEGVQNSFIQNYEDKPIAVIGLDSVIVVNTPHGILVARKDLAQKVGDVSKRLDKK